MVTTYHLRLDEQAFRRLVAGRIVIAKVHDMPVELVLDNVPWNRIVAALADAVAERLPELALALRPPDPPQAREFVTRNRRK